MLIFSVKLLSSVFLCFSLKRLFVLGTRTPLQIILCNPEGVLNYKPAELVRKNESMHLCLPGWIIVNPCYQTVSEDSAIRPER